MAGRWKEEQNSGRRDTEREVDRKVKGDLLRLRERENLGMK